MYIFKNELFDSIKEKYKIKSIAKTVGLTDGYLSQIFNGKKTCPKTTAYAIVKTLNENAEIEDYFNVNRGV